MPHRVPRTAAEVVATALVALGWLLALPDAAATGDPFGQHHSAARQVTPANVGELEVAWTHRNGDVEFAGRTHPHYHVFHPFEHGRIWVEAPAGDGRPGVGAGGIVARYEWYGPYESEGSARVIELSPRRFVSRPRVAGLGIGEFRHEWGVSPEGATYRVENLIGVDWPVVGPWVNALLRRYVFSEGMLNEWTRHQVEEVGLLPHFLPLLHAQRNDENVYHLPESGTTAPVLPGET